MAKAESKHIIEIANLKIGLIGLVEREWIETLSTIGYEDVIYESFVTVGSKLAKELKTIDVSLIFMQSKSLINHFFAIRKLIMWLL